MLIADALNDTVVLKVVLQSLPLFWSTIISPVFHDQLYDSTSGNLNNTGRVIVVLTFGVSLVLTLLTSIKTQADRKQENKLRSDIDSYQTEVNLRSSLAESDIMLEEQRNRHFRTVGPELKPDEGVRRFVASAMTPAKRINAALDELSSCFGTVSGIPRTDFMLSGAIAIAKKNTRLKDLQWGWVSEPALEGTASLDELIKNPSAFSIVANGRPFYYANDKIAAAEKGEYYLDGKDRTYHGGSIVCTEVVEAIGDWRIRLIISISTYGKRIVEEAEEREDPQLVQTLYEDRIRDTVIRQFLGELKEDLLWYAVERINFARNKVEPLDRSGRTGARRPRATNAQATQVNKTVAPAD